MVLFQVADLDDAKTLEIVKGRIEFAHVNFYYNQQ